MSHLIEKVGELAASGVGFRSLTKQIDTTTSGGMLVFNIFSSLGKRGRQAADYAACATRSAVCADQFQGMSSSHRAAGQSAAIFPVTSAM